MQLLTSFIIIILVTFFGELVPIKIKIFLYSLSLSIKEILLFIMPFIIFTLIFISIANFKYSTIKFIILLITMIFLLNLSSSLIAYSVKYLFLKNIHIKQNITYQQETTLPLWSSFKIPIFFSNFNAITYGFILGLVASIFLPKKNKNFLFIKISNLTFFFLRKIFSPFTTIFILGVALKIHQEQVMSLIIKNYSKIFFIITSVTYSYIFLLYGIANSFKIKNWISSIKNMIPAFITAITTISSSITIPFIIECSKKNLKHYNHQNDIISPTILISSGFHLVGDCFFIIILSMMITYNYELTFKEYIMFITYFLLFKFTIISFPGSGIMIILPILENYLKFSQEMLSLITLLYIIFDPIITSANVMGNGAFAIIFTKLYNKFR